MVETCCINDVTTYEVSRATLFEILLAQSDIDFYMPAESKHFVYDFFTIEIV